MYSGGFLCNAPPVKRKELLFFLDFWIDVYILLIDISYSPVVSTEGKNGDGWRDGG